ACGVTMVSVSLISLTTCGISDEASCTSFIPFSLSFLISEFNASALDIDIPIPIVVVLGILGRPITKRFADPTVRVLSTIGNAMRFGEWDLIAFRIVLGTAV